MFYKKAVFKTVSVIVTLLAGISVATTVQAKSYSWSSASDGQHPAPDASHPQDFPQHAS